VNIKGKLAILERYNKLPQMQQCSQKFGNLFSVELKKARRC
jgi:hypothetical protein